MESTVDKLPTGLDSISHYRLLLAELARFESLPELYSSHFYHTNGQVIESVLQSIRQQNSATATPRIRDFLRVVQWNILRGRRLEAICRLFTEHPLLKYADIITLNEVDVGMARTQNLNIAFELGRRLDMHVVFAAEYIELTKGIGSERDITEENNESLHGNAILSRYPFRNVHAVRLPNCFNSFEFDEKRYGNRVALFAELECAKPLYVISTHLEVRHTPMCRMRQMAAILKEVERIASPDTAVIIGGDLNTGTFSRRGLLDAVIAILRLLTTEPAKMHHRLRHPERHEPLFALLEQHGFSIAPFNDDAPTCSTELDTLDEASYLPRQLKKWLKRKLASGKLDFRLDYLIGRRVWAAAGVCSQSGVNSLRPVTLSGLKDDVYAVSDHDPILADITF